MSYFASASRSRLAPSAAAPSLALAWVAAILTLVVTAAVWSYPKPAQVPTRWELDFTSGDLRLFTDRVDGRSYWYFNYTVTNQTGDDQIWAPTVVLFTDVGEILKAGQGVPARVEETIRELLGNPLLETQNEVIGDVFQGREHEKDGLVVWPANNVSVNEMSLFVGGLSGETARVRNPITSEVLILRKTLQRDYLVRGDALPRGSKPVEFVGQTWVMR